MVNSKKIKRESFLWNMIGSLSNAVSSVVLLMAVTRTSGSFDGGMFAFAFSQGQLFFTIGSFEMRAYQSTDVNEKFKFKDYYTSRIITCTIMILISIIYLYIERFDEKKTIVIFLMCVYKMIDALSDVFQGLFQVRERLDIAGKTLAIRVIISTAIFSLSMYTTKNLILASTLSVISSIIWVIIYDYKICRRFKKIELSFNYIKLRSLFKECFPLFLGAFLLMYIFNIPKYGIDRFSDEEMQNFFNILFMPASVINLFSIFLFRPVLTRLADSYSKKNLKKFLKITLRLILWIIVITIIAVICAYFIGVFILSLINKVDLSAYRKELTVMMIGGGFSALSTLIHYVVTVIRKQYILLVGYAMTAIIGTLIVSRLVEGAGILGASYCYLILMIILSLLFILSLALSLKKSFKVVK